MDKVKLKANVKGHVRVRSIDVADLAQIAHRLRQEISDPRLPIYARTNYAEVIQAVDVLIDGAGEVEE